MTVEPRMLLGDLPRRGATLWGGRPALVWDGGVRTHAELADRVDRLAAVLAADGVSMGTRVAVLSPNVPAVVEVDLALASLGAILVPLNLRLTAVDLGFQLDDAGVTHALVHPTLRALGEQAGLGDRRTALLDDELEVRMAAVSAGPDAPLRPGSDHPFMLLYTSGTTGRPKGCLLTQRAWLASNANTAHGLQLRDGESLLAVYPLYHVAGFGFTMTTLALGGSAVFCASASPDELWPLIERHAVTRAGLPGLRAQLASDAAQRSDKRSLRGIVGGANMENPRTLAMLHETVPGVAFHGVYGCTEGGNLVTVATAEEEAERPGTVGRLLPGFDLRIENADGSRAAAGAAGELCLRGASVMSGYWGNPEATAETLRGGWMHTGDVHRVDGDGYLFLVDRVKDMIKSGGENVYSIEVESVLLRHPGVADAAVVGVPDQRWGEAVKAVVVILPGTEVSPEELDHHCRALLAAYKRPRWYEVVSSIERSQTGKIVKRDLRAAHDPMRSVRLPETV